LPASDLDARLRNLAFRAGLAPDRIEPLPGDVGHRRYYRLRAKGGGSALAVFYPDSELESRSRWNRLREALSSVVRVPEVLADDGHSLQLIEDFGAELLSRSWAAAAPSRRGEVLRRAASCAARIARLDDPAVNRPFSAEMFLAEMRKSRAAVFGSGTESLLSPDEDAAHEEFASGLAAEIAGHPTLFVHRDFHADNLFDLGSDIGVIDFQDARCGPDSYDVASLAGERDTLCPFDPAAASEALEAFTRQARPEAGLEERWLRVALQRAWKAAGTFAGVLRASGRRGDYARFLGAQLSRVRALLGASPAERELARALDRHSAKIAGGARTDSARTP
jgi:aminoglycoside/choline kinase family phosphotransferase